ncbi:MAG: M20/M25/M40 family metallo-hydrolase, partial [Nanoarchaeota archaeon]|nr:M20/M25/M40 family metallo-hydrolase [Nanoarchaeota archaeon]
MDNNILIKDLKSLISIPSYGSEEKVAAYIIKRLKLEGFKPKKDKYGNVLLEIGKGPGFLLNAHMDTVGIEGWKERALKPVEKQGRIYGRGASDTKSGIATLLYIAGQLKDAKLKRRLIFLFSVHEEDSRMEQNGSFLAVKNIDATQGLMMEPTFKGNKLGIGVGCKGACRFKITVKGRPCHSSKPHLGVNPIYLADDFIKDFKKIRQLKKTYSILGKKVNLCSVSTITQIKAEEGKNLVPSKCEISIDCRILPGQDSKEVVNTIDSLCKKHFKLGYEIDSYCNNGYFGYDRSMLGLIRKV